jgi:S-adenosylmethionine hydrolase
VKFITLLTDFGIHDGYPGVMKGVIWNIAPDVQIVDLSHDISPQDVMQAALLLGRSAPYFPAEAIHVAVIDPGVGTSRRPIAGQLGEYFFVGPDNGLLTLLLDHAEGDRQQVKLVNLDKPAFWLPSVSKTFHGRDIFAPIAAHLAAGTPLDQLGSPIHDPIRLDIPKPVRTPHGWLGQVIYIDHFGNLSTNITAGHLRSSEIMMVIIKETQISGLVQAFGDSAAGSLIAVIDSFAALSISVVNGSAANALHAHVGDPVEVLIKR